MTLRIEEAEFIEQHDLAEGKYTSAVEAFRALASDEMPVLMGPLPEDAKERIQALLPAPLPETQTPTTAAAQAPMAPEPSRRGDEGRGRQYEPAAEM